jgi:hypothetical protein
MMFAVSRSTRLKVLGAVSLIFVAAQVGAATPAPKTNSPSSQSSAPQGKQWETDAAVRQGMSNILQTMQPEQENIEKKRLGTPDYQRLGKVLDQQITEFLNTRKLSKEAEKPFHTVVMLDLTHAVELMRQSPKVELQRVAALGVLQTLHHYGEYFQHPGWPMNATPSR